MVFEDDKIAPSHYCTECGALWRFHRKEDSGFEGDTWGLTTPHCGSCCDNAEMADQIKPITIGRIKLFTT